MLKEELEIKADIINKAIEKALQFEEELPFYKSVTYLPMQRGKRLRPILALICCEAICNDYKKAIPFGVSLELIHNFTLVHDDVMDKDEFRRGFLTTHKKFGEASAINAGDTIFARAFEILAKIKIDRKKAIKLFGETAKTVREISEGQQMDMDFEKRKIVSEKEYLTMIEKKTAVIYRMAGKGGIIIGGGNEKQANNLAEYGRLIGIGFQIKDDILDLIGNLSKTGKGAIGNDIRRGKKTIIVCNFLRRAEEEDKGKFLKILGNKDANKKEIKTAIELLNKTNSIEFANNLANEYCDNAKKLLNVLPESKSKDLLKEFADFMVMRNK